MKKECICEKCGIEYPIWFCDNDLWNSIMKDTENFICLDCFAKIAEKRKLGTKRWELKIRD